MAKIFGREIRVRNPFRAAIDQAVEERVKARLSSMAETDDTIIIGTRTGRDIFRDRNNWDRATIISETLLAWRTNPIARRITDAIVEFVVGDGMAPDIKHKPTAAYVKEFWEHPLNNLDEQIPEWVAEQSRTGDLFLLCSVDAMDGSMFTRAVPSEQIDEIQTFDNDYRQETHYIQQDTNAPPYLAYDPLDPEQTQFMLHFPINRPVGSTFGEADLTPVIKWLGRLSTLLNDRVIMNHLRNLIVYIVKTKGLESKARKQRADELNANPPQPGAIVVNDESEVWGTLSPNMQSFDANMDILALKKHILVGVGLPLHYGGEPESSTRTTAEAAGTPAFRKFKMRQNSVKRVLAYLCTIAVVKRNHFAKKRFQSAGIAMRADDVTERDNSTLALAAARIEPVLADLFDRELIDEPTYLLLFYEMLGKDYDTEGTQPKGIRRKVQQPEGTTGEPDPGEPDDTSTEESQNAAPVINITQPAIQVHMPKQAAPVINIKNQIPEQTAPSVNVTNKIPEQAVPVVNVTNQVETPEVNVTNQVPEQAAPVVNVTNQVETPEVNVTNQIEAPNVHVTNQVPEQAAPVVNVTNQVETPKVNVTNQVETPNVHVTNQIPEQAAPVVNVQVEAPEVNVTNQVPKQAPPVVNVTNQVEPAPPQALDVEYVNPKRKGKK
jgi:hypothetical protein